MGAFKIEGAPPAYESILQGLECSRQAPHPQYVSRAPTGKAHRYGRGAASLRGRPARPGPVLLYAAEDALHIVRERWWVGICAAAGVEFDALALHVITALSLRLDHEPDCDALRETVARLRPRLLVLDPFVRLHRVNENGSRSSTLSTMRQHPELRDRASTCSRTDSQGAKPAQRTLLACETSCAGSYWTRDDRPSDLRQIVPVWTTWCSV
jgi:hypothetical protein